MKRFAIGETQHAQIRNVNVRKEKNGPEDSVAAIDLKMHFERVPLAAVGALMGVTGKELEERFYLKGGKLGLENLKPFPLSVEFANKYQAHIGNIQDRATKVSKFKVTMCGGAICEVECKVAVSNPNREFLIEATENLLEDSVKFQLQPVADLFDDLEGEASEAA